jgi:hypothetical protein
MNLDTVPQDVFNNICYHMDPNGYSDLVNSKPTGDIVFVSSEERRSEETLLTYTSLQDTDFKVLACVNKSLFAQMQFFVNQCKRRSLKEPFYKEAVIFLLKNKSIEFFLKKISIGDDQYHIGATLDIDNSLGSFLYQLEIFAVSLNNSNNQFNKSRFYTENIASMLFSCTKNKEQVKTFINDIKLASFKGLLVSEPNVVNQNCSGGITQKSVLLRFERKKNDEENWNLFPLQLFCQLANFAEKIVS